MTKKEKRRKELEEFNNKQEELDNKLKNNNQKYSFKNKLSRMKFETYTKRLVFIVVLVCLIDLQLSYILAFLGKDQIAESLSTQICITILGTVITYLIRAYFDTKAEKKNDKENKDNDIKSIINIKKQINPENPRDADDDWDKNIKLLGGNTNDF